MHRSLREPLIKSLAPLTQVVREKSASHHGGQWACSSAVFLMPGTQPRRGRHDVVNRFPSKIETVEPHDPKACNGRPPVGCERMLRRYIAQRCFGLPVEGIEDAIDDSGAISRFVRIDLGRESAPDATTVLKFR